MKPNRQWTLIIARDSARPLLRLHISLFYLKAALWACGLIFFGALFLISGYFRGAASQWEKERALRENARLKKRLYAVEESFNSLQEEVFQMQTFARKVRMMTSVNGASPFLKRHGKVAFSPELAALASPSLAPQKNAERNERAAAPVFRNSQDLLVSIKRFAERAKLAAQDVWSIHSALLAQKDILSGTPSILPVNGWISSPFGYRNEAFYADHDLKFHQGMDIAADIGEPVAASASGRVIHTGYDDTGYGKLIIIDHGWEVKTFYAHLSEISAKSGQWVSKGDVIGLVGNTGKSTGPHVHYEIRWAGVPVDPANFHLNEDADLKAASKGAASSIRPDLF